MNKIEKFRDLLETDGLHVALRHLNSFTPFRFTGVYRFEGDSLRNVALFDRWQPGATGGDDAPLGETFCAIVGRTADALEVVDGPQDPRFPWMHGNPVMSYCGAPVFDSEGRAIGTLCHFDLKPCQAPASELPHLREAARFLYPHLQTAH